MNDVAWEQWHTPTKWNLVSDIDDLSDTLSILCGHVVTVGELKL